MEHLIELNARNITNMNEINNLIQDFIEDGDIESPEIINWLHKPFMKYIQDRCPNVILDTKISPSYPDWLKESIKEGTAFKLPISNELRQQVEHIIDYFSSMDDKELEKIYKIPYEVAVAKSKEWTKTIVKHDALIPDENGESLIREYNDKCKWVRILTPNALNIEGNRMDHCVGTYDEKVLKGKSKIYSLRDPNDRPQCTIEVVRSFIKQIKGYNDGPVLEYYCKHVIDFIDNPIDSPYTKINDILNIGFLIDSKGKKHDLNNLPDNLTIYCDVNLSGSKLKKLPKNLTIIGDLILAGSEITIIPEGLTVENLTLWAKGLGSSQVTKIMDNVTIKDKGYMEIPDYLLFIGKNFKTGCNISMYDRDTPVKLSENMTIGGYFHLEEVTTTLPKNMTIGEDMILTNMKIKKLPANLKVGKILSLFKTNITVIPKDLQAEEIWVDNIDIIKNLSKVPMIEKERRS